MRIWVFLLIVFIISSEFIDAHGKKDRKKKDRKKDRKDKQGKGKDRDKGLTGRNAQVFFHPISGQRIRFGGDDKTASSGNLEVFLRNKWGIVCDDGWDKRDADLACKQMGFPNGASAATSQSQFGLGSWNTSDFLMTNVACSGHEASIFSCRYSDQASVCLPSEGAGLVCKPNTGCQDGWIGGPDSCYFLSNITTTKREFAVNKCNKIGGYLANIETWAENNFISNAFAGIEGEPIIIGGVRDGRFWMWEKVVRSSNNDNLWTVARRRRRRAASRLHRPQARQQSYYGRRGSPQSYGRNTGNTYSYESISQTSIQFFKWFPGWQPGNEDKRPSGKKNKKCLYLTSMYRDPNRSMHDLGYLYWENDVCKRTNKFLKYGFRYLCEREKEEVVPELEARKDAEECYRDSGFEYRGSQAVTTIGTSCVAWTQGNKYTPEDYPGLGLEDGAFCRNPDNDTSPWCYVDADGTFGYCPVPECDDEVFEATTLTMTQPAATTTAAPAECPGDKFYCPSTSSCIAQQWRCDFEPDCDVGEDEDGCEYSITQFHKLPSRGLPESLVEESFVGVSNETCADICLGRTSYVCRSFAFNPASRKCDISNTNTQLSGTPSFETGTSVYELASQSIDCEGMYTCDNGRCIQDNLSCNNVDNCGDMSDENDCGEAAPVEVRLADGKEHSGRVEIKYRGEWGVICDDSWDNKDATVICRMLAYNNGGLAHSHAKFGEGNKNFLLDEVACTGLEDSIEECSNPGWKKHDCRPYEAAGVECIAQKACTSAQFTCSTEKCIDASQMCDGQCDCLADCEDENGHGQFSCRSGKMLIVNGSQTTELYSGRVVIERNGLNGTVCDFNWDDNDATVVCNVLGFTFGKAAAGGTYGAGKGAIWLSNVNCDGTEASLSNCDSSNWGDTGNCRHSDDAGVVCTNTQPTTQAPATSGMVIQLMKDGSQSRSEGRVEILWDGIRGTVCDDHWDNKDATVVCKMLGYRHGTAYREAYYGPGHDDSEIWLDEVACTGTETSLAACGHQGWGTHDCGHGEDAGVSCTNSPPTGQEEDLGDTWTGVPCGQRPLETNSRKRREVEDAWEEREVAPPKMERIIGGFTASKGFYPWQVGVRKIQHEDDFGNKYDGHWCGGTILSEYWILSAAHCYSDLHKSHLLLRIGDHDNKRDDEFEQEFEVDQLINHPLYDDDTFDYDLALIKVKALDGKGIKFSDHVQPACLPDETTEYETDKKCHISGWGKTESGYPNLLKSEKVPLISDGTCSNLYKDITRNMVCAGYLKGGIDSCAGDSGGPLVCEIEGRYIVMGATSYGAGCAEANAPGVYARVTAFLPWIKRTIASYL